MACCFLGLQSGVMHKSAPTVRCAIYTRKSTEEGLDQEFNSLHAEREAGEAYIKSQKHLGWTLVSTSYDDGGFKSAKSNISHVVPSTIWPVLSLISKWLIGCPLP
jgi:hypothetical protein